MERSDSTIRHSSFDIFHFRGSTDPYDEHSHVGPQLDGGVNGAISGWIVTVSGGWGGCFAALFRREESKL
jgi:hypothetical protein